jgi:hypothetical protein
MYLQLQHIVSPTHGLRYVEHSTAQHRDYPDEIL